MPRLLLFFVIVVWFFRSPTKILLLFSIVISCFSYSIQFISLFVCFLLLRFSIEMCIVTYCTLALLARPFLGNEKWSSENKIFLKKTKAARVRSVKRQQFGQIITNRQSFDVQHNTIHIKLAIILVRSIWKMNRLLPIPFRYKQMDLDGWATSHKQTIHLNWLDEMQKWKEIHKEGSEWVNRWYLFEYNEKENRN